jgi:hypothetical protein
MGQNTLASSKMVRTEPKQKEYIIPYVPAKLKVEHYTLFNKIIGTVSWTKMKLETFMDVTRTFYEAIYPYIDMVVSDNESLYVDNDILQKENARMIIYLKETDQWEKYQEFLKSTLSKKSEPSSTSSQESTTL